jgi:hypothetical protein
MVEIITTDEFAEWYGELDEADTKAVIRVVDLLASRGVSLPFPYSSEIKGSQYALRELREGNPYESFMHSIRSVKLSYCLERIRRA